jgi:hypothetical protein
MSIETYIRPLKYMKRGPQSVGPSCTVAIVTVSRWENENLTMIKKNAWPDAKTCDRPKLVPRCPKSGARVEQWKKDCIDRNREHYKSQASEKMDDRKRTRKR